MFAITHNGPFHADDVLAYVILTKIYDDIKLIRTRDQNLFNQADCIFDVGGVYDPNHLKFDHHQKSFNKAREKDNIQYSSAGLVWLQYGMQICENNKHLFNMIDNKFIKFIDATDNGQELYDGEAFTISNVISSLNPNWDSEETFDEAYFKAVNIMEQIFDGLLNRYRSELEAVDKVIEHYNNSENKKIIVFDNFMPFQSTLSKLDEPLFAVFRNNNNTWIIQSIDDISKRGFQRRINFPQSWGGLNDKNLERVNNIKGSIFCHSKLFIAGNKTKEGALKMAEKAIENEEKV